MTEATTSRDTVSAPSEAAPAVSAQSTGPGAGRRVLVTGGSRGIGFAVAKRLAEEGYVVAVNGRKPSSIFQSLAVARCVLVLPLLVTYWYSGSRLMR